MKVEVDIGEIILEEEVDIGDIELDVVKEYPDLENLTVTPSAQEQNFKSNKYGYNTVKVKAIESDILNIVPSEEVQKFEGIFNTVNLDKINIEEKNIDLVFGNDNSVEIIPNDGKYIKKVTVNKDENLLPENIRKSITINGILGTMEGAGEENAIIASTIKPTGGGNNSYLLNQLIKKVPLIDMSTWTSIDYLFYKCQNIEEISFGNTETITSMKYCFYACNKLTKINNLNTSRITNMQYAFGYCIELKDLSEVIPALNTVNVTDMQNMFLGCSKLKHAPNLDTNKVQYFNYMYQYCSQLIDVPSYDTKNALNLKSMFNGCSQLETIGQYDASKVSTIDSFVSNCSALKNFGGLINLGKGYTQKTADYGYYTLNLSSCYNLTHESLMNVINNLYDLNLTYDVANGGTLYKQTLNLGSTNKAKLTEEEIAIATNKGWNVV